MSTVEEAYLAQHIFRAEVGRYAKDWAELSKIASFRFKDKEQYGIEALLLGEQASEHWESEPHSAADLSSKALVIEPVSTEEKQ
jgi:hypothetical protein